MADLDPMRLASLPKNKRSSFTVPATEGNQAQPDEAPAKLKAGWSIQSQYNIVNIYVIVAPW
jgi:hypothetical protein